MNDDIAIDVQGVSKSFRLPHEKYTGLKQAALNFRPGKKYEMQHVLKDISLDIKKGEFFGIVGRNGSGKSTLLKVLAQIYTPEKGGVAINGSLTPFIELGVGFNPELTGRENVYLNGALLGFDHRQVDGMYQDIVDFAEIERFMDQKLKNYSSGMQVRLAFSIAIRAKSDILLIDEVLAVGDAAFQQKCFSYFEEMRRENRTIILVTHDMSAVNRFCDRALIIENGRIKQIGKPSDIADVYALDNIQTSDNAATPGDETHKFKSEIDQLDLTLLSEKSLTDRETLVLNISYRLNKKIDPIIGIRLNTGGVSAAEMNSRSIKLNGAIHEDLTATFRAKLEPFNPGLYSIDVAVFDRKNFELKGHRMKCAEFVIKGSDMTRGGIIKLNGEWN